MLSPQVPGALLGDEVDLACAAMTEDEVPGLAFLPLGPLKVQVLASTARGGGKRPVAARFHRAHPALGPARQPAPRSLGQPEGQGILALPGEDMAWEHELAVFWRAESELSPLARDFRNAVVDWSHGAAL